MSLEEFLEGITDESNFRSTQLKRRKEFEYKAIAKSNAIIAEHESQGWIVDKRNVRSIRMKRRLAHSKIFENLVWTVFSKMFNKLNIDSTFKIPISNSNDVPPRQIDVFCFDEDTALVFECKSKTNEGNRPLQQIINDFANIRSGMIRQLNNLFDEDEGKRKIKFILATNNITVSDNDKARLEDNEIILFTDDDIKYYDLLVSHIGEAAKYQLFGRIFKGQDIPSLDNRVPAIRGKMGGHTYYSFSIEPEKILKLSYILHNNTTSEELAATYQRMVNKVRIKQISEFLDGSNSNDDEEEITGFFPNSIIVNFDSIGNRNLEFNKASGDHDVNGCSIGILKLPRKFRSGFIIDGQHRLYGYSKSKWKSKHTIPVVAFENLPVEEQTKMFIDINHKQKSVSRNLLTTIKADINWNSPLYANAIFAVQARMFIDMSKNSSSSLYKRIKLGENKLTGKTNITLDYVISYGFKKTKFFAQISRNSITSTGFLWNEDYYEMLRKAKAFFNKTFKYFQENCSDQWELGSSEGGFISMNIGIASIIRIVDSILLESSSSISEPYTEEKLYQKVKPKLAHVANYVNGLSHLEIKDFRAAGTGGTGRDNVFREFEHSIKKEMPSFSPAGFDEWLSDNTSEYNDEGKELIDRIEIKIGDIVFAKLEELTGSDQYNDWAGNFIPREISISSYNMMMDTNQAEPQQNFLFLIDFRKIMLKSWTHFEEYFEDPRQDQYQGGGSRKEKATKWLSDLNGIRSKNAHPRRAPITEDEIEFIRYLDNWLVQEG